MIAVVQGAVKKLSTPVPYWPAIVVWPFAPATNSTGPLPLPNSVVWPEPPTRVEAPAPDPATRTLLPEPPTRTLFASPVEPNSVVLPEPPVTVAAPAPPMKVSGPVLPATVDGARAPSHRVGRRRRADGGPGSRAPVTVGDDTGGAGVTTMLRLGGEVESACGPADRAKLAKVRLLPVRFRTCWAAPSWIVSVPPVAVGAKVVPVTDEKAMPRRITVSL